MGSRWVRASAAFAVSLGLAFAGMASANAHAQLVAASPAPGSTASSAPGEVRLTFDGPPSDYGLAVVVLAPSGSHLETGRVSVDGNDVVQPLSGASEPGTYRVLWRVVSADGHPASGQYAFDVNVDGQAGASGAAGGPASTGSGKGWLLLPVAALAVVGLVALLLFSGRRRAGIAGPEGPSA